MKKRTKTKVKKNSFTLDFVQSITQSFNHFRQSLASFIIININNVKSNSKSNSKNNNNNKRIWK